MNDDLEPNQSEILRQVRERTPARILVGRAGPAYLTNTWLALREDHAAALDAVHAELDFQRDLGAAFVEEWKLFEVRTQAVTKQEYLVRPDLGRRLDPAARDTIGQQCPTKADVQIVIADGLSAAAVVTQVPALLPLLVQELNGLTIGRPFVIRHARVGVLNDIGELLRPKVVILLIGERPGLATAESLSAYLAYRPDATHTDANRNLISNIHGRGVPIGGAAARIAALSRRMIETQTSGFGLKEELHRLASMSCSEPDAQARNVTIDQG